MTHIFTKRGQKGFTLIELLVVIAIIGLLSTVIAAPIQNARKKSRDAKKIAELKAVELALDQYAEANRGEYPRAFSQLAGTYMPILPTFATSSLALSPVRDKFGYSYYEGQLAGGGGVQVFAYHLGVHLESVGPALDSDRDCNGTVSNNLLIPTANLPVPCSNFNGDSTLAAAAVQVNYTNWQAGMMCADGTNTGTSTPVVGARTCATGLLNSDVAEADFGILTDGNTVSCNLVNDCIFDMGNQQ